MSKLTNTDYYDALTAKVLSLMEEHGSDWVRPWAAIGAHHNPISGTVYSGSNAVWLSMAAAMRGFTSPEWSTYKGWTDKGGQVMRGAKSEPVVFWKFIQKKDKITGSLTGETIPLFRSFSVFNIAEVDGVEPQPVAERNTIEAHEAADAFLGALGADVRPGGDRAFYAPAADYIGMPDMDTFADASAYYSVLAHEHIHWSGHKTRTDRLAASPSYAFEELVAELGAAFLCAELGIDVEPRPDHAKYLNNWLQALQADPKAIYQASSRAAAAVRWMHAQVSPEAVEVDDEAEAA